MGNCCCSRPDGNCEKCHSQLVYSSVPTPYYLTECDIKGHDIEFSSAGYICRRCHQSVRIPETITINGVRNGYDCMLMSESSLAKIWDTPEEDAAWKDL